MKKAKLNYKNILWFIVMFLLGTYFLMLILNDKLHLFIHPKMFKYVFIASVILYILCIFQVTLFTEKSKRRESYFGFLFFFIILFFAYIVKPQGVSNSFINSRLIDIHSSNKEFVLQQSSEEHNSHEHSHGENESESHEFLETLNKTYTDVTLQGETLKLRGIVYRDNSMKKDEFILGRMLVSCCAADSQFIGFLCESNKEFNIKEDQWVEIIGEVDYYKDELGNLSPRVIVNNIKKLSNVNAENQYIYN